MKKISPFSTVGLIALAMALPTTAHAHVGVGSTHGLLHGAGHPLGGLDHICAMVAVGLWAAQIGGRALWAVPLTFVSVMALSGGVGMSGVHLLGTEQGIVASVLILGVLISAAIRLPLMASMAIIGTFAICHGYAHGAEMPNDASGFAYGLGFMISTAFLHLCGIGLGVAFQKLSSPLVVRFAGGVITCCGIYLATV